MGQVNVPIFDAPPYFGSPYISESSIAEAVGRQVQQALAEIDRSLTQTEVETILAQGEYLAARADLLDRRAQAEQVGALDEWEFAANSRNTDIIRTVVRLIDITIGAIEAGEKSTWDRITDFVSERWANLTANAEELTIGGMATLFEIPVELFFSILTDLFFEEVED